MHWLCAPSLIEPVIPRIDRTDFQLFADFTPNTPAETGFYTKLQDDMTQEIIDQGYKKTATPWWHRWILNLRNPSSPCLTLSKIDSTHSTLYVFIQAPGPDGKQMNETMGLDVRYTYFYWTRFLDDDPRKGYPTEAYALMDHLHHWWKKRLVTQPHPREEGYRGFAACD